MTAQGPSTRRFSTRILIPLLAIPITAATVAPPPEIGLGVTGLERSAVLHPISRIIESADDWHVVARYERPRERSWALVAWHDGPARHGQVDPSEIIVLEQNSIANALVVTTYYGDAGPCDPLDAEHITDDRFPESLRHDLRYCSRAIASAEDPRSVSIVKSMLKKRVRKLDEPSVSLTSAFE